MNTTHRNRLFVALGAALFAGSMLSTGAAAAQESEFQAFSSQVRAKVRAEATRQPGTADRLQEMQRTLDGVLVHAGLDQIRSQGEEAIASIRSEALAAVKASGPRALGTTLAQANVVPVRVADSRRPDNAGKDWALPEVEIKPLIDLKILLFSFRK